MEGSHQLFSGIETRSQKRSKTKQKMNRMEQTKSLEKREMSLPSGVLFEIQSQSHHDETKWRGKETNVSKKQDLANVINVMNFLWIFADARRP